MVAVHVQLGPNLQKSPSEWRVVISLPVHKGERAIYAVGVVTETTLNVPPCRKGFDHADLRDQNDFGNTLLVLPVRLLSV